jgi:hypothetical protein
MQRRNVIVISNDISRARPGLTNCAKHVHHDIFDLPPAASLTSEAVSTTRRSSQSSASLSVSGKSAGYDGTSSAKCAEHIEPGELHSMDVLEHLLIFLECRTRVLCPSCCSSASRSKDAFLECLFLSPSLRRASCSPASRSKFN